MASSISANAIPYYTDDRDFGTFSDHVTVWIDKYIGVKNTYTNFKAKFDNNIQVLHTKNDAEVEIDDETMLYADPTMLQKLADEAYCLKYFSTIDEGLTYIQNNPTKRIFFISSGTIGKEIVPQIAKLSQIQGIYIFCGDISKHTEWATDYVIEISGMFEHEDNLLERITRDIATYLEEKGDQHTANKEKLKARNCYSWSKKLLVRAQMFGDCGSQKFIDRLTGKINELLSSTTCND